VSENALLTKIWGKSVNAGIVETIHKTHKGMHRRTDDNASLPAAGGGIKTITVNYAHKQI